MKKAPGQLYITQFVKSFISIRFPNFASLVVDVVTKNVFFNSCPLFSTPVLTSQFWYFDDIVGFREYFSLKRTYIIIAYYTYSIPAPAVHLLEMWEILPEKSIFKKNRKYNLQIQWQSCKRLQHLKKQGLVQMSWNFRVLNDYMILEQLSDLW